jgi:hypothetical protein
VFSFINIALRECPSVTTINFNMSQQRFIQFASNLKAQVIWREALPVTQESDVDLRDAFEGEFGSSGACDQ